jgi:hypothetical protein
MTLSVRDVVGIPSTPPKGDRPAVVLALFNFGDGPVALVFAGTTQPPGAGETVVVTVTAPGAHAARMGLPKTTYFRWPEDVRVAPVHLFQPWTGGKCPMSLWFDLKEAAEKLSPDAFPRPDEDAEDLQSV